MHEVFIAQKSNCACRVLSLATIRSKTILILFQTELGQAENFLITPRRCADVLPFAWTHT